MPNMPNMSSSYPRSRRASHSSMSSQNSLSSATSTRSYETQATSITNDGRPYSPSERKVLDTLPYTPDYIPRKPPVQVILGTASVGSAKSLTGKISTVEDASAFVQEFRSRGYLDVDTARNYPVGRPGTCEKLLGEPGVGIATANVSTKVLSFHAGAHKFVNITANIDRSLRALRVSTLDIVYLHAPDRSTPFEEACRAMDAAHRAGKFERFGLSNFTVPDVEQIMALCRRHDYIRPSVYQGQYNLLCRSAEPSLLPTLRKHHIAFHAYSPSACGFLSDTTSSASARDPDSRWSTASPLGAKYAADYFHPELFAAAAKIKRYAAFFNIPGHAAALRWVTWHSQLDPQNGDAIIVGASSVRQLKQNLDYLEQGPLPAALVKVVEGAWEDVKGLGKGPGFSLF